MGNSLTCAFTGHRPSSFHFGYDEQHPDCVMLKLVMAWQIAALIDNGVYTFLTGMSPGVDFWGAEIVLAFQRLRPELRLIAALPCETQANKWSAEQRERYFNILAECDEVVYIGRHYTKDCMFRRNRWLIDHANFVIAVYNGAPKGGTAFSVGYAYAKKRAVILINPDTCAVTPYMVAVSGRRWTGEKSRRGPEK